MLRGEDLDRFAGFATELYYLSLVSALGLLAVISVGALATALGHIPSIVYWLFAFVLLVLLLLTLRVYFWAENHIHV